jgi:L-fuculose-phosphate aldolase
MNWDQARSEVVTTCLTLADQGYLAGTGGNVAYRFEDDHFAVTPSAVDYYEMKPEDVCIMRLHDLASVSGERRPSVEYKLHANVLRHRRDCRASIHTHQPIASAYTLLARELETQHPEQRALIGPKAAFVGYAPSGTGWLAQKLMNALKPEINAYLLRNHGVLCCGPTLGETVARLEALESACSDFFRNAIKHRMGSRSEPLSSEVLTLLLNSGDLECSR